MSESIKDIEGMCRVRFHFSGTPGVITADIDKETLYQMLDQTEDFEKPEPLDDEGELPSVAPTTYHMVRDVLNGNKEIIMNLRMVTYMEVDEIPKD